VSALAERLIAARDLLRRVHDDRVTFALEAMAEAANAVTKVLEETGLATLEEVIDRALVGASLMDEIASLTKQEPWAGWMPNNDPAEIVFDMVNHYEDCLRSSEASRVLELEAALGGLMEHARPSNWDDDDDPEHVAAWLAADEAIARARP
jgi:hypothetical protein